MKIHIFDAHDRHKHLIEDQSINIWKGADDCLKKNPLSLAIQEKCPYVYIFAHPRTHEDGVNKKLFWQPRIGRPAPQTNSYLFRAISNTDIIEVCWLLPPRELWSQYENGKVTESNWTLWSINQFRYYRNNLNLPHPEDLDEEKQKNILKKVIEDHENQLKHKKAVEECNNSTLKLMDRLYK